jgi:hypothetical protein
MAITKLNPVAVNKKIARFTASGTWIVPAGVPYAIGHIRGGGGGVGSSLSGGKGGTSSIDFGAETVEALGGEKAGTAGTAFPNAQAAQANSGNGAAMVNTIDGSRGIMQTRAEDGALIVAGAAVTPAGTVTVTVGAGGTAGSSGAAGGSGYVYIEYYE